MNTMQNFSRTDFVTACYCIMMFFWGFKTDLVCYYLNECHAEFFGTNLVIACYCICCFFLGFKTENLG